MKRVKRLFAFAMAMTMLLPFIPSKVESASLELDKVAVTILSARYADDVEAGYDTANTWGSTTGVTVYDHYMLVPVNYMGQCNGLTRAQQSQIMVYDLDYITPALCGRWDKESLGIQIRNTDSWDNEDFICGIHIDDTYMYVATETKVGDNYAMGIYVYNNPFYGGVSTQLEKVNILPNDETIGTVKMVEISKWHRNSPSTGNGLKMQMVKGNGLRTDALITMYGDQRISNSAFFTVTAITEDETNVRNDIFYYKDILTFEENGTSYGVTRIYDMAFDGDKAYVLARTDKQSDYIITNGRTDYQNYYAATFGLFTISFEKPFEPIVTDVSLFDTDFAYNIKNDVDGNETSGDSGINNKIRAYMTVSDGYAYVSTCNDYNFASYFDESMTHIYVLEQKNGGFEKISRFSKGVKSGLGEVQVVGNILVGVCAESSAQGVKALLSDDKTEILDWVWDSTSYSEGGSFSLRSAKYKNRGIFVGAQAMGHLKTDTNRGVIYLTDMLTDSVEFDNSDKINNVIIDNIYASFETPYAVEGINKLHITGKNTSTVDQNVQIIFAVYRDNILIKTTLGEKQTVLPDGNIDFYSEADLTGMDLNKVVLKAYLWEDFEKIKPLAQVCAPPEIGFTFTLDEDASTSAGVYDSEDNLIRTLWGGIDYEAGTYEKSWDGKDDYGNFVPDGNYRIDVMSSNVHYEKIVDVIGNTSDCSGWDTYIAGSNSITDMAFDSRTNRIYYCTDHVEGAYGLRYLNADNIHRNAALMDGFQPNMTAFRVAVDGERVYWASEEVQFNDYGDKGYKDFWAFIYATDDTGVPYTFEYGERQNSKWTMIGQDSNGPYPSAINRHHVQYPAENNRISGLEVQQTGNLLFSSYLDWGKVFVNDKNTGQLLYTLESNMPGGIALQGENILWVAEKNEDTTYTVNKYQAVSDGTPEGTTLTKIGSLDYSFANVLSMAISSNGSLLAITDGGERDMLFVANTTTGELVKTFGSGESYYDDPTVKDDKLVYDDAVMFKDAYGLYEHSFVEFISDTELLIGDSGNARVYKLNLATETPTIIDTIIFLRTGYSVFVTNNDPSRIYGTEVEYSFDYDKAEQYIRGEIPFTDTWKLTKNFTFQCLTKYPDLGGSIASRFIDATLFDNGITYFGMQHTNGKRMMYMLIDNQIEPTGIDMSNSNIHADGSLWSKIISGNTVSYYRQELLGYDNYIPQYGEMILVAKIGRSSLDNTPYNADPSHDRVPVTDSGKLISLNSGLKNVEKTKMHLGAIDISNGYGEEWNWMAAPGTSSYHNGCFFPEDGYLDIGCGVGYTTWQPSVLGNHIICHYRGEGYQSKQANKFLHFYENGLLIDVYGRTLSEYGGTYNIYGGYIEELQPCNSMCANVVGMPGNSDIAYIFQNTEGCGGGVHVARLTGMDSVKIQSSYVTYKNALVQGVKFTCFDDANLDSAYASKTGVSNTFELPCLKEANANHSVRFEGYYRPEDTGSIRFAVRTDGVVRLVIDSQTLIDGKSGDIGVEIFLEKGMLYKFKLEVSAGEEGISYLDVGHSTVEVAYRYINMNNIYCDYPEGIDKHRVNLLEGLPYGQKTITLERYGWTTQEYGGYDGQSIVLGTSRWNYRRDGDNDLYMGFTIGKNSEYSKNEFQVDRSLGDINSDNYVVDMDVRFMGGLHRGLNPPRKSTTGAVIELLDVNDKVIANHWLAGGGYDWPNIYVFGNNTEMMQIYKGKGQEKSENVSKFVDCKVNLPQNLKFYIEDGMVAVEYMGTKIVTNPVDADADIMRPAKVRFARYNEFSGAGYSSNYSVTRFVLHK